MNQSPPSMSISDLEGFLQQESNRSDAAGVFPSCGTNRYSLYLQIKSHLQNKFYRSIDGALSADTNGAPFTMHDISHVDDVIQKASELVNAKYDGTKYSVQHLGPFDVFILLIAILIHDVGNLQGRTDHQFEARPALRAAANDALNAPEIKLISDIAQAHGGKTKFTNLKDTISELRSKTGVENFDVNARLLAAIVRLADEISENPRRANTRPEAKHSFPNCYCQSISCRADYKSRTIAIDLTIEDELSELEGRAETGEQMLFLDYVKKRIAKTEAERRYCSRYMQNFFTYERLRVQLEFLSNSRNWRQTVCFDLSEAGFPNDEGILQQIDDGGIDAAKIAEEYRSKDQT